MFGVVPCGYGVGRRYGCGCVSVRVYFRACVYRCARGCGIACSCACAAVLRRPLLPRSCHASVPVHLLHPGSLQRHKRRACVGGEQLLEARGPGGVGGGVQVVTQDDEEGGRVGQRGAGAEEGVAQAERLGLLDQHHLVAQLLDLGRVLLLPVRHALHLSHGGRPAEESLEVGPVVRGDDDGDGAHAGVHGLLDQHQQRWLEEAVGVENGEERGRRGVRGGKGGGRECGGRDDGLGDWLGRADLQGHRRHPQLSLHKRNRRLHVLPRLAQQLRAPIPLRAHSLCPPDVLA
mmetsp:Transcript_22692/g.73446  ORF Transcript_22692/g.73446 Transcript_22692/m.73446 type:complete len:290 (+) Transcript_22692:797-1666(+)